MYLLLTACEMVVDIHDSKDLGFNDNLNAKQPQFTTSGTAVGKVSVNEVIRAQN